MAHDKMAPVRATGSGSWSATRMPWPSPVRTGPNRPYHACATTNDDGGATSAWSGRRGRTAPPGHRLATHQGSGDRSRIGPNVIPPKRFQHRLDDVRRIESCLVILLLGRF